MKFKFKIQIISKNDYNKDTADISHCKMFYFILFFSGIALNAFRFQIKIASFTNPSKPLELTVRNFSEALKMAAFCLR